MTVTPSRLELSRFLKLRRSRLLPADVGLPTAGRRRAHGLKREEVAVLAGVGLTWYTWFEQGRDIQVSTHFIENLARALRLSDAERAYLFNLAQHRSPPAAQRASDGSVPAGIQEFLDAVETPAYVRNKVFDVLGWNRANTRMFGDFARIPERDRNILRLMFGRPNYKHTMPNWENDAQRLVEKLRLNFGAENESPLFLNLIEELTGMSPDFGKMWAEHAVSDWGEGVYLYQSPRSGRFSFRHQTLVPESRPDLRIVVYLPI